MSRGWRDDSECVFMFRVGQRDTVTPPVQGIKIIYFGRIAGIYLQ